jgi:hypothetical protein
LPWRSTCLVVFLELHSDTSMSDSGLNSKAPGARTLPSSLVFTALASLLLAVGFALPGAGPHPASAQPQDTIRVAGTTLVSGDSAEARRLLQADLAPTSHRWTRLRDSTKRFGAAKTVFQIARLAYPSGAWTDSVLTFLREAGTGHPDPKVRAEFLYGGLQVAESAERGELQRQFYQRLTRGHEGSHYAKEARRLFAPNSQIRAGKELPQFEVPRLSDSTTTVP